MRRELSLAGARSAVLLLIPAAGACGGAPKPADVVRSARSWGATAQLVVDRWEHGAISRKFAVIALDRASSAMASAVRETAQLPDTTRDRDRIVALVATTRRAVAEADSAVRRSR